MGEVLLTPSVVQDKNEKMYVNHPHGAWHTAVVQYVEAVAPLSLAMVVVAMVITVVAIVIKIIMILKRPGL